MFWSNQNIFWFVFWCVVDIVLMLNRWNEMMGMKRCEWNDEDKVILKPNFCIRISMEWNTSFNKVNLENDITKSWMKGRDYLDKDLY